MPSDAAQQLAALAERSMQLQATCRRAPRSQRARQRACGAAALDPPQRGSGASRHCSKPPSIDSPQARQTHWRWGRRWYIAQQGAGRIGMLPCASQISGRHSPGGNMAGRRPGAGAGTLAGMPASHSGLAPQHGRGNVGGLGSDAGVAPHEIAARRRAVKPQPAAAARSA